MLVTHSGPVPMNEGKFWQDDDCNTTSTIYDYICKGVYIGKYCNRIIKYQIIFIFPSDVKQ